MRYAVSPRLALALARLLRKRSIHVDTRSAASEWLTTNPEVAALGLVPAALGENAIDADIAEDTLRTLMRQGHEPEVRRALHRHGEAAEAAFEALDARLTTLA